MTNVARFSRALPSSISSSWTTWYATSGDRPSAPASAAECSIPRATELAPGIHSHSLGHGKGGHVHAFLVDGGGELSLVDTLFESDARLVLDAIRSLGRKPSDLKRIAITHGHRSHLGGLAALKRATHAIVYAHEFEADIVSGDRRAQPVSILPRQSLKLIPFQLGLRLGRPKHVPCPVDEPLGEGDSFGPFRVLHAAGHSPGHLAFSWAERGFLIAGDAVATWPSSAPAGSRST